MLNNWDLQIQKKRTIWTKIHWNQICIITITNILPELLRNSTALYNAYQLFRKQLKQPITKLNPQYTNHLQTYFKLNYKVLKSYKYDKYTYTYKPQVSSNTSSLMFLTQFKTFMQVNITANSSLTIPHFSFRHFYIGYRKGGLVTLNIPKLFAKWKNAYYLLFNLSYYQLESLLFGTSFFKTELLALNWNAFNSLKFLWRYSRPFLFYKPSKITDYGDLIYYRLNLLGLRTAVIVDILYHHKTIYYLHRSRIYSIGLVPTNHHIKSVNFAIPTGHDSILTQLFFIRFLLSIRNSASELQYTQATRLWTSVNY